MGAKFAGKEEHVEENKGIMVILVGAPGSGKSTFCQDVMKISNRPWSRVCQVSLHFAVNMFDEMSH